MKFQDSCNKVRSQATKKSNKRGDAKVAEILRTFIVDEEAPCYVMLKPMLKSSSKNYLKKAKVQAVKVQKQCLGPKVIPYLNIISLAALKNLPCFVFRFSQTAVRSLFPRWLLFPRMPETKIKASARPPLSPTASF